MSKLFLPDVTLLFVEGVDYRLSKHALDHCLNLVNFGDYKIITSDSIIDNHVINIGPLPSVFHHSNFMFGEAYKYIDTEFFLAAQWDGVIWDPTKWTDKFLDYDYIGAPWPPCYLGIRETNFDVGNGGFSLRSKRLYEFTAKDIKFDKWQYEDVHLCRHERPRLEQLGFKFAPTELAWQFSYEAERSGVLGWEKFALHSTAFGLHGSYALNKYLPELAAEQYKIKFPLQI